MDYKKEIDKNTKFAFEIEDVNGQHELQFYLAFNVKNWFQIKAAFNEADKPDYRYINERFKVAVSHQATDEEIEKYRQTLVVALYDSLIEHTMIQDVSNDQIQPIKMRNLSKA